MVHRIRHRGISKKNLGRKGGKGGMNRPDSSSQASRGKASRRSFTIKKKELKHRMEGERKLV